MLIFVFVFVFHMFRIVKPLRVPRTLQPFPQKTEFSALLFLGSALRLSPDLAAQDSGSPIPV